MHHPCQRPLAAPLVHVGIVAVAFTAILGQDYPHAELRTLGAYPCQRLGRQTGHPWRVPCRRERQTSHPWRVPLPAAEAPNRAPLARTLPPRAPNRAPLARTLAGGFARTPAGGRAPEISVRFQ